MVSLRPNPIVGTTVAVGVTVADALISLDSLDTFESLALLPVMGGQRAKVRFRDFPTHQGTGQPSLRLLHRPRLT